MLERMVVYRSKARDFVNTFIGMSRLTTLYVNKEAENREPQLQNKSGNILILEVIKCFLRRNIKRKRL